jgi:7,8-dihydropterin-6-yl-methyl-4-(beta-D-ribofuranosyl)aminobenzene 5'-phosphate synthase
VVAITILVDNAVATPVPRGLRGEWGFAAAVDDVLFDTGQSSAVVDNARLLDVPTRFDDVVLSHAHYDHTGGLSHVLDPTDRPTVYCHPELWTDRYSVASPDGEPFPEPAHVGIPYSRSVVESGGDVVEHTEPVEVADGVFALGEIPREHAATPTGKREDGGRLVDDPVPDDQAIAVRTGEGTALVLGCCHAGLRNAVEYAETVTGEAVRYVVGGTHLIALDDDAIHDVADWLAGRLDVFAGTHCTGAAAERILADRLPDAFRAVGVGSTIRLPPDG